MPAWQARRIDVGPPSNRPTVSPPRHQRSGTNRYKCLGRQQFRVPERCGKTASSGTLRPTSLRLRKELLRQSVQHFQAPPYEVCAERKSERHFEKLNYQFASAHRCTVAEQQGAQALSFGLSWLLEGDSVRIGLHSASQVELAGGMVAPTHGNRRAFARWFRSAKMPGVGLHDAKARGRGTPGQRDKPPQRLVPAGFLPSRQVSQGARFVPAGAGEGDPLGASVSSNVSSIRSSRSPPSTRVASATLPGG
jgi:hypothetical protein